MAEFGSLEGSAAPVRGDGGQDEPVRVMGLLLRCWQCARPTMALVGVVSAGGCGADDLVVCGVEPALVAVAGLLSEGVRVSAGVGPIRPRYSRTAGRRYVSNGCFWCDALQGNFFVYGEHLPAVLAEEGLAGLCPLVEARG